MKTAAKAKTSKKWIDSLSEEDHQYLQNVIAVMRYTPRAALYVVAKGVKLELGLSVSVETVAKTIRELLSDEA